MPQLLRREEVAEALGVSTETVRKWARSGELRSVRIGKRGVRYPRADVERIARRGVAVGQR